MKKIMNKINFALVGVIAAFPAFADTATNTRLCQSLQELHKVFELLRTMAFIGAAFYIAGWAWGYISGGKAEMGDIKTKGQGLLVGFSLLFLVGVILSFIMSATGAKIIGGCEKVIVGW